MYIYIIYLTYIITSNKYICHVYVCVCVCVCVHAYMHVHACMYDNILVYPCLYRMGHHE